MVRKHPDVAPVIDLQARTLDEEPVRPIGLNSCVQMANFQGFQAE
jgi:hypothetical protein